ncbi:MAG TPA: ice-binding family protein [Saprospiraceae bacterium]|nr:ice-binding family protein [Saprospiraceae bacterium]
MIKLFYNSLILCFALLSANVSAQVGIGTNPDSSAVLDLYSTDRGFLAPRLTLAQRDLIDSPANGLMIYNTTSNEMQVNNGSPMAPFWGSMSGGGNTTILSFTAESEVSTEATLHELISGVTMAPPGGNYLVLFNGQFGLLESAPVSTAQGAIDLTTAYNNIMALTADTTHGPIFGNNEILTPGIYNSAAAASFAGKLTLDGGGDPNAIFIVRVGGALTSGAGAEVELINGANARNIFWVAEGAIALAAGTIMKGTLISNNAAVAVAAGSIVEGRLFSTAGAVSFGPGEAYIPTGTSFIDLGVLSSFLMFTSAGALANTGTSILVGDVGTHAGAIAGFIDLEGNIYAPGLAPNPVNNTLVTFSIFMNGELVANSSRTTNINTSVIALQAYVNIPTGQSIDISL